MSKLDDLEKLARDTPPGHRPNITANTLLKLIAVARAADTHVHDPSCSSQIGCNCEYVDLTESVLALRENLMTDKHEAINKMGASKPRRCKHGCKVGAGYVCGRCLEEMKQKKEEADPK